MKDMEEDRAEQHQGAGHTVSAASASEPTHEMTQILNRAAPTPTTRRSVSFGCDDTPSIAEAQEPRTVPSTSTSENTNADGERDGDVGKF